MFLRRAWKTLALITLALAAIVAWGILDERPGLRLPFGFQSEPSDDMVVVTYTTRFLKCDCIGTSEERVPKATLESYLASVSPEWRAAGRRDSKVEFMRQVDDYCSYHARNRLIILQKGYVHVYRGETPDSRYLMREFRELAEGQIPDVKTRELLKQGVKLEDDPAVVDAKVRLYLEGITD